MKTLLPWLVAIVALGVAGVLWSNGKTNSAELAKLQLQVQETESLRAEIAELKKTVPSADELERLRRDNQELIRLRGEVGMIRKEKEQVAKQLSSAQTTIVGVQQQQQQQLQQLQTENQRLLGTVQQSQQQTVVNACINNLRQIDGAKQQWALENRKVGESVPKNEDLQLYLPEQKYPTCPGQGRYTLNAVDVAPTCSVSGHALPKQE